MKEELLTINKRNNYNIIRDITDYSSIKNKKGIKIFLNSNIEQAINFFINEDVYIVSDIKELSELIKFFEKNKIEKE